MAASTSSAASSCTWFACGFAAALLLVQLVTRAQQQSQPELPQSPSTPMQLPRTQRSPAAAGAARVEAATSLSRSEAASKGSRRDGAFRGSYRRYGLPPPPQPLPPPPPAAASVNEALCRRHPKLVGCARRATRSVVCKRHPKAAGCAGRSADGGSGPGQMPAVRLTLQAATANRSVVCSRHPKARGCAAGALATPAAEEPPSWGAAPPDPLVAAGLLRPGRRKTQFRVRRPERGWCDRQRTYTVPPPPVPLR